MAYGRIVQLFRQFCYKTIFNGRIVQLRKQFCYKTNSVGRIAQQVERVAVNREVMGSNPILTVFKRCFTTFKSG